MMWETIRPNLKIGDRLFDPDCPNMKGERFDGTPLSSGMRWGTVVKLFGNNGWFLVLYDNKTLPMMHSPNGFRYDRAGVRGATRVQHQEEVWQGMF